MANPDQEILFVVELGGYPLFSHALAAAGYRAVIEKSVRKAMLRLKRRPPAVLVAEFNFQSDFRDRICNLGACPRIGVVARESTFEADFSFI